MRRSDRLAIYVLTTVGIKYNRKNQQLKTVVIPIIFDRSVPIIVPMEKKNSETNNTDRMKYKKYTFRGTYKPLITIKRSALQPDRSEDGLYRTG